MGHQWKNKHGWTCRCVCFVLYCLELDLHGVCGGGVWIMTVFRAEPSRDLNLALTLGVPEGSSSSSLGFCVMCPGDACCPQGHWEWGHVSAAAADAPIRTLAFVYRAVSLGLKSCSPQGAIFELCAQNPPWVLCWRERNALLPRLKPHLVTD